MRMQQLREQGIFSHKHQQQQQQAQPTAMPPRVGHAGAAKDDGHLFSTPSDLVCPITLSLFQDPVCNAVGQVYERAALQRHLLQAAVSGQPPTDPVSNAVLPSLDLVPVWPMRSRAAEYRDSTIHACVQAAAAPDCADPVKYLRRAAELVLGRDPTAASRPSGSSGGSITPSTPNTAAGSPNSSSRTSATASQPAGPAAAGPAADATAAAAADGPTSSKSAPTAASAASVSGSAAPARLPAGSSGHASTGVPGLTLELAQYLVAHRGSQYDALLLKYFGNELLRSGFPDAASNVFYRLLLEAEDRVQQAEYLQLCLDCWTCSSTAGSEEASSSSSPSSPSIKGGCAAEGKGGAAVAAAAGAVNSAIVNKLADFVQRQRCLGPRAIIQMLESTHHGSAMAMQLCQVLLTRAAAAAAAAAGTASAGGEAALGLPGGLGSVLEVLLELIELGQRQLTQQVQQLTAQVQELQALQQQQDGAGPQAAAMAAAAAGHAAGGAAAGDAAGDCDAQAWQHSAAASSEAARAAAKKHRHRGRGHHWKGGKGVNVVVGRVLRLAAAGTLAAASLASGNHPVLRAARVGPLLYLLRAGL